MLQLVFLPLLLLFSTLVGSTTERTPLSLAIIMAYAPSGLIDKLTDEEIKNLQTLTEDEIVEIADRVERITTAIDNSLNKKRDWLLRRYQKNLADRNIPFPWLERKIKNYDFTFIGDNIAEMFFRNPQANDPDRFKGVFFQLSLYSVLGLPGRFFKDSKSRSVGADISINFLVGKNDHGNHGFEVHIGASKFTNFRYLEIREKTIDGGFEAAASAVFGMTSFGPTLVNEAEEVPEEEKARRTRAEDFVRRHLSIIVSQVSPSAVMRGLNGSPFAFPPLITNFSVMEMKGRRWKIFGLPLQSKWYRALKKYLKKRRLQQMSCPQFLEATEL